MVRIELVPHSPNWAATFDRERTRLAEALGDEVAAIHHIGSTSVPHLAAKPIVDVLMVSRVPLDVPRLAARLKAFGYTKWIDEAPEHVVFYDDAPRSRNLHVFPEGAPDIAADLAFRDALRNDATLREEYEALKRELAQREWRTVQEYADAKGEFIRRVKHEALARATDANRSAGKEESAPRHAGATARSDI